MIKRIASSELRQGMYIHKLGGSWMQHPFLRSSFLVTNPSDIKRILQAGIKEVWIDESKGESLIQHSEDIRELIEQDNVEAILAESPSQPSDKNAATSSMEFEVERARKLFHDAKEQVKDMYGDARLGKAIDPEKTLPLVEEVDAMVQRNSAAMLSVARLKTHDDYTYMHSVAVCALMLSLAHQLNLDEEQTRLAGVGGLMHDLGKALMPLNVLNKAGKLTEAEFDIMKKHPAAGAKLLLDGGAESEVVDIALHHHEKMNGFGYPHGLKGEEISLLARMGAICDVYDAVTSIRPYKQPWGPANSIREMARWEGHFDKQIFNAFVKSVGIYPVGSLVRLASQRLAVVIEPSADSLLTPKVKVFFSLKSRAPIQIQVLDLAASSCQDSIEGPEDPDNWEFKHLDSLWQ